MSHNQYSNDDLLEQLRRCKNEHGQCPPRLFNNMEETVSPSLITQRFGSWSNAKEKAGIEEDLQSQTGRSQQYTDEKVLRHLRECADRNDGKCTVSLLSEEEDLVSPAVAVERFGTWSDAKEKAGLRDARQDDGQPREYTEEDYLKLIRECERKYGKATQRLFDNDEDFSSSTAIRRRFGSWSAAKEQAGVEKTKRSYTDEELLDALRTCKNKHGSVSASTFAADDNLPSPETLQRRFGSWNEAKKKAGVGRYADG